MLDSGALPPTTSPVPRRRHGAAIDQIPNTLLYHQQTKHHLDRYARSLGYLDWASQPDPFRIFKGAMRVELPLAADGLDTPYTALFTPLAVPAKPLDLTSIAILFELAPAAAICTPPRAMPSCRHCRTSRRASITM